MTENKNVEAIVEENIEIAVSEEKKEGLFKKGVKFVKDNWKEILFVVLAGVGGYAAGKHAAGKSEGCDCEDCDAIEDIEFVVEDAE